MADSYVVGVARSGTTLLLNQLICRYEVTSVPETHYFSVYGGSFVRFRGSLHYDEVCAALQVDSVSSYEEIWELARKKSGVEHAIEKTPKHLRYIKKLPVQTKVVIMRRCLVDTVRSNLSAPWNLDVGVARIFAKVLIDKAYAQIYRLLRRKSILTVEYSDLVTNPEESLSRVANFLRLKPRPSPSSAAVPTASDRELWKVEATQSVYNTRKLYIGAWPRYGESNVRNTIMYDSVDDDRDFVLFDIKKRPLTALFCDVVHFHWPEKAFEGRKAFIKVLAFLTYCTVLRLARVQITQTVHNDWRDHVGKTLAPMFRQYQRCVSLFFVPSRASIALVPAGKRWKLLPLGLYPKIVENPDTNRDYYLIVGRLTRKKNIDAQLRNLVLPDGAKVIVAGLPEDHEYDAQLRAAARLIGKTRGLQIELRMRSLSELEIHRLVAEAKCVLAAYEKGLNSGVLTLAATYETPVLTNLEHLRTDMRRLYGQRFTLDVSKPVSYARTDLSIERVADRYKKLIKRMT